MTTETKATLNEGLHGVRAYISQVAPAAAVQAIEDDINRLLEAGTAQHALKAGDSAPDFNLPNIHNEQVGLSHLLSQSKVVLVFYRGAWCPYCNLTLATYQAALEDFKAAGAQLVAVSAQTPDNSLSVAEKNALTFQVLSDHQNAVARQYGLVFQVGEALRPHLSSLNADVPSYNGEDSWELPIPGVFVIGQDGVIKAAFVDADFRNRPEVSQLLAALQA